MRTNVSSLFYSKVTLGSYVKVILGSSVIVILGSYVDDSMWLITIMIVINKHFLSIILGFCIYSLTLISKFTLNIPVLGELIFQTIP